jgi:hypothetical protein
MWPATKRRETTKKAHLIFPELQFEKKKSRFEEKSELLRKETRKLSFYITDALSEVSKNKIKPKQDTLNGMTQLNCPISPPAHLRHQRRLNFITPIIHLFRKKIRTENPKSKIEMTDCWDVTQCNWVFQYNCGAVSATTLQVSRRQR